MFFIDNQTILCGTTKFDMHTFLDQEGDFNINNCFSLGKDCSHQEVVSNIK